MLASVCGPVQCFEDWNRVSCHGNIIFIAAGVFPIELLACQISMICAANWPR